MNEKEVSEVAAELGLERACSIDPDAFAAAIEKARSLANRIPSPRSFADQPAHVLSLPDCSKDGGGDA